MKKITVALILITFIFLISGCCSSGGCGNYNADNCCGSSGNGNWY